LPRASGAAGRGTASFSAAAELRPRRGPAASLPHQQRLHGKLDDRRVRRHRRRSACRRR
jgi:hypothetical protein